MTTGARMTENLGHARNAHAMIRGIEGNYDLTSVSERSIYCVIISWPHPAGCFVYWHQTGLQCDDVALQITIQAG